MRYEDWPKIDINTPIEEVKRIHQMIWDYVIETGYKPIAPYAADCAACEYASRMEHILADVYGYYTDRCMLCPLFESDEKCGLVDSLYSRWGSLSRKERKNIALMIRDHPFKFEREEEEE